MRLQLYGIYVLFPLLCKGFHLDCVRVKEAVVDSAGHSIYLCVGGSVECPRACEYVKCETFWSASNCMSNDVPCKGVLPTTYTQDAKVGKSVAVRRPSLLF
jgi:hypothetical protein